jgi:hypothetical protein
MRTFGVEEELLLVDAATGVPVALADLVARPESGGDDAGGDHDAAPASAGVSGVRQSTGDLAAVVRNAVAHTLTVE